MRMSLDVQFSTVVGIGMVLEPQPLARGLTYCFGAEGTGQHAFPFVGH